ncbi:hypothetical protein BCL90_0345 [Pedobacter alluvionis]|uniref:Uncharacterized protein n=1 Tax=Pedobacter alluvionis TaxID=475253 RepID=A0A497YA82_9SPHI|nr:hypothetical protein [Pedobacter alluvionis]RLJ79638.1 hypothetical protein BCL90_0345 [Pedobacter alluvionis]
MFLKFSIITSCKKEINKDDLMLKSDYEQSSNPGDPRTRLNGTATCTGLQSN